MAKKGQQVQLQAELTTEEEWEKFLSKDGLLLIDIYSDWCGPCSGMAANLKKIKLEFGGDLLLLAIAKNDHIKQLERFRGRSEPTWLFVSKGKKVNMLFGCNAPLLKRVILEEIKKEEQAASGEKQRDRYSEITDLEEIEIQRQAAIDAVIQAAKEKEEAKRIKEYEERKIAECNNILENLPNIGTILIFPCGRDKYHDVLNELMKEASLITTQTEKVRFTEEELEELMYFEEPRQGADEYIFDGYSLHNLLNEEALFLAVKPSHGSEVENIDKLLLEMIYGPPMKPPGSEDCPYRQMLTEAEDEESGNVVELIGIWVPAIPCVRATVLRLFFPKLSGPYVIPEPEPEPEHLAIIFDKKKTREALRTMGHWPEQIMNYGFFSNEDPEDTELIAKSVQRLEDPNIRVKRTYEEKLVIQLSKKKSECVLTFAQIGPIYISPNPQEGARECALFFPDDYSESLTEEERALSDFLALEPDPEEIQVEEEIEEVQEPQEAVDAVEAIEASDEDVKEELDMNMFMMM
ncbi:uncharacterized protein LOC130901433 isoform X3 [Diorhabda carinulata]|uniref:uncharacterized protein LOC130901433 isoform X3 n=1 Tax=Diorhabda carinulata TaxID=1163345 RepID=UPI0025A20C98|nr:uncharacterized protein LOC130901433 isoform X3 [Diorhabda carinulata]